MLLHQVELHILNENSATPKKDENPSWGIGKKLRVDLLQYHKGEWDMEHSQTMKYKTVVSQNYMLKI